MGNYSKTPKNKVLWGKQARTMSVLQSRRDTIYKMKTKRNDGICPCYVCGMHVELKNATLEHIVDRSAGGTNARACKA